MKIDLQSRQVWKGAQEIILTRLEYEVLGYLARRAGKVVTFQELWRGVWENDSMPGEAERAVVRQAIKRVRGKLDEDWNAPRWICCVHGVGFRFRNEGVRVIE